MGRCSSAESKSAGLNWRCHLSSSGCTHTQGGRSLGPKHTTPPKRNMIAWRRWHFRGRVFKSRHPKISKRRAALRWHEIGRFLTQSGNGLRIGGLSSVSRSPFRHTPTVPASPELGPFLLVGPSSPLLFRMHPRVRSGMHLCDLECLRARSGCG